MKKTNPSTLAQIRKFLFCFLLTIMYCWIIPAIAQIKKADTKTPLPPPVSNEVFEAIAQFYEYDRNMPLEAKIVNKEKYQDTNKEKIFFNGANNNAVPSYLIIPKNSERVHPVILLADGIYGSKDRWLLDDGFQLGGLVIKAFLEKGFAVMACDAVYHGERSYQNKFSTPWLYTYPYLGTQMIIQTAIDYRRAIDYLYTRVEIDTTRIGILGLSMGGLITFALTSIDPRIKSAIAGITPLVVSKEKELQPYAPTNFANRVNCNSFLMFMGNKDNWYSMKEARQVFDMIPIKNKEFVEYNTGHDVTKEYVDMTANWFVKNLKP